MEGSIELSAVDHKTVLAVYRGSGEARTARRAHVLLLLADGHTYREIMELLFCSAGFISGVVKCFRDNGVASILRESNGASAPLPVWSARMIDWLCERTPQDFGYYRSRWSCATLAEALAWETGLRVCAETVRRVLQTAGYVWRRPRPVVGPEDPEYVEKRRRIQRLLEHLPQNETAVFQDEVEVHLNPKIGSMWMPRGQQAEVVTPGNNEKCHVAGSLVWRTGTLIASPPGLRRNTELFLDHLDELRGRLRGFRKIHVICDNAAFHKSRMVREYLERWKDRIALHFLPCYAPETNPIERIWWRMHETITRNHRCTTLTDLVAQVYEWITQQHRFVTETLTNYARAA
jgi:transposase